MSHEPEGDLQMLLNLAAVKRVYQNVDIDDEDEVLRLRASKEFLSKFNGVVYDLLAMSIQSAAEAGRTTLQTDDVPEVTEDDGGSA